MNMRPDLHLAAFGVEMAPCVVTSADIEERMASTWERLGIPRGQIEQLTGVRERRWWETGTSISAMAARACQKALDRAGMSIESVDRLIYTGVCREGFEPATACAVAHQLGAIHPLELHDLSNACLGTMDAIVLAEDAIRSGRHKTTLVVSCESARDIVEIACENLNRQPDIDLFTRSLATWTGGSGAAALLLVSSEVSDQGPRLVGSAQGTDSRWHELCRWGVKSEDSVTDPAIRTEYMETDAIGVLRHGVDLGLKTWNQFLETLNWSSEEVDRTICHQVGSAHRQEILPSLGISPEQDYITFPFLGNIGTVSIPMTAALAAERGVLLPGHRVAFLGIGSGLVCRMLAWEWR
ncbi:MAG: 3-oxoacyl-ACP synthase III [Planctomycetota bacterium]